MLGFVLLCTSAVSFTQFDQVTKVWLAHSLQHWPIEYVASPISPVYCSLMAKKSKQRKKGVRIAMSADHVEKTAANGELREGANVDKIRDILFGSNMREYEKRFARLEERLTKSSDALREDLNKRFDSLESYVREELESLGQRLKNEKSERSESLKELTRESREASKSLEKKLSQLEEALASAQGDLRSRILEQSKTLGNQIQKTKEDLETALESEAGTLRADKTDRAMLADLFNEFALRLKGELELPEK